MIENNSQGFNLGLLGSTGRMGRQVQNLVEGDYAQHIQKWIPHQRGEAFEPLLEAHAIIDFSLPEAVMGFLDAAEKQRDSSTSLPALALGSTGWDEAGEEKLRAYAKKAPVLIASNFSTGVFALQQALKQVAPILKKLGYEPVLTEAHHQHKKDAPSGTAKALQKRIDPESPESIQTHSIRAGEVIGQHQVNFYGKADFLTFEHFAQDRTLFGRGALDVALWLASQKLKHPEKAGFLSMEDYFQDGS